MHYLEFFDFNTGEARLEAKRYVRLLHMPAARKKYAFGCFEAYIYIRHLHPHFQSRVVCGLEGCVATPSSFQALRQHIYQLVQENLTFSE